MSARRRTAPAQGQAERLLRIRLIALEARRTRRYVVGICPKETAVAGAIRGKCEVPAVSAEWRTEVERPWVGMTTESMTEVEQACAKLASALDALREKLDIPARLRRANQRAGNRLRRFNARSPLEYATLIVGVTAAAGAAILTATLPARPSHPPAAA